MNFHNRCRFQVSRHIDGFNRFTAAQHLAGLKYKVAANSIMLVELLSFHACYPIDVLQR